jgi:hypothetical protein
MPLSSRRWRRMFDWLNPIELSEYLYGRFFLNHPYRGGIVFIGTFTILFSVVVLFVWVRGVDRYKEKHSTESSGSMVSTTTAKPEEQGVVNLSEEAKNQIVQKLAKEYQGLHPGGPKGFTQPMVNWINKKLRQQKMEFYVSLPAQSKSRGIVVEGSKDAQIENATAIGYDEGIVIKDSPGAKFSGTTKAIAPKQPQ